MSNAQIEKDALIDRDWCGYHPRAALPTAVLALVASLILLVGRWLLHEFVDFNERTTAFAFYALTLALWPVPLFTHLYRMITYTYRITDRALLVDWGPRHLPEPPLSYRELHKVRVDTHWLGRMLGIGNVQLQCQNNRTLILKGIRQPERFADAIRSASVMFKSHST